MYDVLVYDVDDLPHTDTENVPECTGKNVPKFKTVTGSHGLSLDVSVLIMNQYFQTTDI